MQDHLQIPIHTLLTTHHYHSNETYSQPSFTHSPTHPTTSLWRQPTWSDRRVVIPSSSYPACLSVHNLIETNHQSRPTIHIPHAQNKYTQSASCKQSTPIYVHTFFMLLHDVVTKLFNTKRFIGCLHWRSCVYNKYNLLGAWDDVCPFVHVWLTESTSLCLCVSTQLSIDCTRGAKGHLIAVPGWNARFKDCSSL